MTRVLHVTTTDSSLELLLGPQLRAFRDAGYEVHTASAPGPFVAGLVADGIVHHPLRHVTRAFAPGRDAAAPAELFTLFRRLRPDIVHTHNPKPGVYGRMAARAARLPLVVNTQHGLYAQPGDRLLRRWPRSGRHPPAVAAAQGAGVRFLGHRDDPERLYAAFDIYALASHREGFPRSAMEAAASALPIVASDIRGCREVVEHERTGLLVPVRDPEELEAAISRLAGDPLLRRRLGEAAVAKARAEFDQQRVIERTLDAYAQLNGRAR